MPHPTRAVRIGKRLLLCLECAALLTGVSLLGIFAARHLSAYVHSQAALQAFDDARSGRDTSAWELERA